ncbi:MAG: ATP-binding protein [Nitrospirota bacterium]|nr:ATP-binding protein [Nitrospirota bacterium]
METREIDERQLYNSNIIRSFIRLIDKKYSSIDMDDLLEYAGMKTYQIEDDGHWFTQKQVNLFHERLVRLTGKKDIAREAGMYSSSRDGMGPMRSYLLSLMGLPRIYELMGKWTTKFTRSSVYASKKIAPNKVEITVTPHEGVREEPFQCENRLGYVEGFSRLFNASPPKVQHPECLFRGDKVCRYIISWQEPASALWRKARNLTTLLLSAVGLYSLFLLPLSQTASLILPPALIVGLFFFWAAERSRNHELQNALDEISASTDEKMEQISVNYDNSLLINEIGQAFSSEMDIEGVLEKISDILRKRLAHGRGLFMLANREKDGLIFRTGYGFTEEQLGRLKGIIFRLDTPESCEMFSVSFHEKRPVIVNDLDEIRDTLSPCDREYVGMTGSLSLICCPIVYEDEPLGVLVLDNADSKKQFRQSDVNLLMGVASQVASRIHYIMLETQLRQTQKMEAVGSLAGGIAHDFNNILTSILGYSEMIISMLPEGDPIREKVRVIYQSGEKAAALTSQLLAFSRKQFLDMKVNNLNTIVEDLSRMLGRLIGEDIVTELRTQKQVGNIMADVSQIEQILLNLVVNARDAMPNGGHLAIETGEAFLDEKYAESHNGVKPGAYAVLTVSDTGMGMNQTVRERIFEPFFTTKEAGKGTGLGLSTVYGIVKQHRGHINVYSEPGKGTTFKIFFPLVSGRVEEKSLKESRTLKGGAETILLVDDDPSIRRMVVDTLDPLGYTLIEAACGEEALRLSRATKAKIELLLSDVVMPGINGRQLLTALKKERPEIKALLMSGYPDHVAARIGELDPGVAFINKPFSPVSLTDKIREVLDKSRASA